MYIYIYINAYSYINYLICIYVLTNYICMKLLSVKYFNSSLDNTSVIVT